MPETRVIDIAKSQGMSAADVLMRLRDAGFDVTAAASTVDESSALAALAGNGTTTAPRPAAPARPAAPQQPAPSAQPAQRSSQAADSAASNRRVFEPDGPPLQMRGRREEEPYAQQPMPRPTGTRPSGQPAARGGQSGGAGGAGTRPAPRTGPTIVEDAKVRPAPTPPPPLRRAAPAQPAQPAAGGRGQSSPARQAPSRRAAAPSGPPLPKPSSEPARRRSEQIAAARAAEQQAQQPATEGAPATEADEAAAAARAARGPKIIAQPEPVKRPTRDETKSQPQARGGRPGAAGGPGGKRRVVIDSQAARRGPGGPGGPGGGPPFGGPPKRRGKSRGRRRREVLEEVATPLAEDIMTRTDLVRINSGSTVKDVAEYLGVPVPEIIKKLMGMGEMVTLTQTLSDEAIGVLAEEFNRKIEIVSASDEADEDVEYDDEDTDLVERPPVVTIMGHVDHGKTSLLDAIRSTEVASGEAGGITQHIGAYQVHHNGKTITFLDTPGHEAFTAMRARGGQVSDISVVVVAADDGVMPQTREAVDHSRAADVPILVAVNKVDKEGADPTRVRTELTQLDLQPSEWGGETEYVDVSAKTRQGLEDLLDTILVVAELEELTANPDTDASGVVIESKLDPGRGPVVTTLIQRGTLHVGDALVGGEHWGKVRAMVDYKGDRVQEAVPGDPVEVLGFDGVPDAGDFVRVVENDRTARQLANERAVRVRNEMQARRSGRKTSFDDLFKGIQGGEVKELDLVLKADVSGSLEAFEDEIARLPQDEVSVNVIHSGVGGINESDVMLAAASDAVILGFNVRPVGDARQAAEREGVEVRSYAVIYQALDDLRDAMTGMLEPDQVEETIGTVEVRATFKASRVGTIAGSYVTDGVVRRGSKVRVIRDGTVIYDTTIDSLKRFNDDAREVAAGYECGIVLANYPDVKEGDVLEAYEIRSVERALS